MDEFTQRRLAKAQGDAILNAANVVIDQRYPELKPHGLAIVELLHATAIAVERIQDTWPKREQREFHIAEVFQIIGNLLGVSDAQALTIVKRIYQQES